MLNSSRWEKREKTRAFTGGEKEDFFKAERGFEKMQKKKKMKKQKEGGCVSRGEKRVRRRKGQLWRGVLGKGRKIYVVGKDQGARFVFKRRALNPGKGE